MGQDRTRRRSNVQVLQLVAAVVQASTPKDRRQARHALDAALHADGLNRQERRAKGDALIAEQRAMVRAMTGTS